MLPQPIKAFLYFAVLSLYSASAIAQTYADIGKGPGGNLTQGKPDHYYGVNRPFLRVRVDGDTCYLENEKVITVDGTGLHGDTYAAMAAREAKMNANIGIQFVCAVGTSLRNSTYPMPAAPSNDIHYYATKVVEMYEVEFGIELPLPIKFFAHDLVAGTSGKWYGKYGGISDSLGIAFDHPGGTAPWATLVGHEVTHALIGQTSQLVAWFPDAGRPSHSGIMAEAIPEVMGNVFSQWLSGTDNPASLPFQTDPTAGLLAIQPSGSIAPYRYGELYQHAFYRLAATTDSTTNLQWGVMKAARVILKANAEKWRPTENFANSVCGLEAAAADLGYNVADVTQAFAVVFNFPIDIPAPPPPTPCSERVASELDFATTLLPALEMLQSGEQL